MVTDPFSESSSPMVAVPRDEELGTFSLMMKAVRLSLEHEDAISDIMRLYPW